MRYINSRFTCLLTYLLLVLNIILRYILDIYSWAVSGHITWA